MLWRLMAEQSPAEEGLLGLEEGRMSNEIVTYTTMGRNNNTSLQATYNPKLCKVSLSSLVPEYKVTSRGYIITYHLQEWFSE